MSLEEKWLWEGKQVSRKQFICFVNKDAQRGTGVLVGVSREGGQHRGWRGSDHVDRVRRASLRGGTSNNRRLVTDHASGHISKCIRADGSQGLVQRVGTWKGTKRVHWDAGWCWRVLWPLHCESVQPANSKSSPSSQGPSTNSRTQAPCKMANSREHPRPSRPSYIGEARRAKG